MTEESTRAVHWSFWLIAIIALVWNVMGVMNFLMQMTSASLTGYSETARAIVEGRPAWATAAFAIGVFGGALGCLLLLLRKSAAYYLFVASLLGSVVTMLPNFGLGFGPVEIVAYVLVPLVVAAFLIWYAKRAERSGWVS